MLSLTIATSGCAGPSTPQEAYRRAMDKAHVAAAVNDPRAVLKAVTPAIEGKFYGGMTDAQRHDLDQTAGFAFFQLRQWRQAHTRYVRASDAQSHAPSDLWYRMETAKLTDDFDDTFASFLRLANERPEFVARQAEDLTISVLEQGFGTLPDGPAKQRMFESYLAAMDWKPVDPLFSPDVVGFHRALHQAEDGVTIHLGWLIDTFDEPMVVATVGADKRFDAIVAGHPDRTNVALANFRRLTRFKALAANAPDNLAYQSAVVGHLSAMGRETEALAILDRALQQAPLPLNQRDPDYLGQYDHAVVQRSFILFKLGRTGEALEEARVQADPQLMGQWLVALGEGRRALKVLAPVDIATKQLPTRAYLAALRVCAAHQAGDRAVERDNLDYLRAHPLYDPGQTLNALLCVDDAEGAARHVRDSLADPRRRHLILGALQIFLPPPVQTPFEAQMETRRVALRDRPDVRQAVDKVGRINRQPIEAAFIY